MITEKWHDLRKDPNDLPNTSDWVWVIRIDYPKEIDMDSYDPNDRGKEYTEIIGDKHENYLASGWWNATRHGMITHWMYVEKPEPPTD